jgi:hypothetical protein
MILTSLIIRITGTNARRSLSPNMFYVAKVIALQGYKLGAVLNYRPHVFKKKTCL